MSTVNWHNNKNVKMSCNAEAEWFYKWGSVQDSDIERGMFCKVLVMYLFRLCVMHHLVSLLVGYTNLKTLKFQLALVSK